MRGQTSATTIEYFLWTQDGAQGNRLIYYDQKGNSCEKDISSGALDNALRFFSTKVRSVRRSAGGLVLAEPTQIVLFDKPGGRTSVRIQVKFKDLRRQGSTGLACVTHTKTVAPEELTEPFSFEFDGPRAQAFAIDFGRGIIPVRVFGYEDDEGTQYAYFLEIREMEQLCSALRRDSCVVQPYRVPQSVLRWIGPASANPPTNEMTKADRNYRALIMTGETIVPAELKTCTPIEIPPLGKGEDAWTLLRDRVRHRLSSGTELTPLKTDEDESEILLPFRILE